LGDGLGFRHRRGGDEGGRLDSEQGQATVGEAEQGEAVVGVVVPSAFIVGSGFLFVAISFG
jgi:hypothetical protein